MSGTKPPFSFWRWVAGLVPRFVVWNASIVAIARGYSWLFGYDDEVKAWALQHRPEIAIILVLGSLMYGIMDWMRSTEP